MEEDTIVARATAPGESAVALVRLSGPRALFIAARHLRGKRSPERAPSHHILFGTFVDAAGAPIDSVLVSVFRAPRSYTGEDVAEISSHGGTAIPEAILDSLLASGARPARPGEFTERAYRNGKLDLAQAESVAQLIRARSEGAARAARATLDGDLSRRVARLDAALVPLLAEVEARIDFPSEVGEPIDGAALARSCGALAAEIDSWLLGLPSARRRESGLRIVLAGPPNVGKSSLLNALLGYERAIVSAAPGTTRDTVEASLWIEGLEVRLTDTAGLRPSSDPLERSGMERAARALEHTDLAVVVLDRSDPESSVRALAGVMGRDADGPQDTGGNGRGVRGSAIVAWNKADLARPEATNGGSDWRGTPLEAARVLAEVGTVAIRPGGAESLREAIRGSLPDLVGARSGDELPTTSARQESLLADARASLARAESALREDASYDLVAFDLTDARRALGEIVGRGVDPQVVAAIFARFCIGK